MRFASASSLCTPVTEPTYSSTPMESHSGSGTAVLPTSFATRSCCRLQGRSADHTAGACRYHLVATHQHSRMAVFGG